MKLTVKEFYEQLLQLQEIHEDEDFIGVRWEEKNRVIGEEVERSKHNLERENEDDMPEYGTEEYEDMFELDGSSSLTIEHVLSEVKRSIGKTDSIPYGGTHCYLIIGTNDSNLGDALDYGEIVIVNAKVEHKFY